MIQNNFKNKKNRRLIQDNFQNKKNRWRRLIQIIILNNLKKIL